METVSNFILLVIEASITHLSNLHFTLLGLRFDEGECDGKSRPSPRISFRLDNVGVRHGSATRCFFWWWFGWTSGLYKTKKNTIFRSGAFFFEVSSSSPTKKKFWILQSWDEQENWANYKSGGLVVTICLEEKHCPWKIDPFAFKKKDISPKVSFREEIVI